MEHELVLVRYKTPTLSHIFRLYARPYAGYDIMDYRPSIIAPHKNSYEHSLIHWILLPAYDRPLFTFEVLSKTHPNLSYFPVGTPQLQSNAAPRRGFTPESHVIFMYILPPFRVVISFCVIIDQPAILIRNRPLICFRLHARKAKSAAGYRRKLPLLCIELVSFHPKTKPDPKAQPMKQVREIANHSHVI